MAWLVTSDSFDQNSYALGEIKSLVIEPGSLIGLGEKMNRLNQSSPYIERKELEIIVAGDVMLGRTVNRRQIANGWDWALREIASEMAMADWTIVNLEAPLIKDCPPTDEGMIFCGDARSVEGLKVAGVGAVTLANNHILNYGVAGLEETKEVLREAGIEMVGESGQGNGSLVVKEIDGIRLGLLGFDGVSQVLDEEEVIKQIYQTKRENRVDFMIVTIHWGVEYEFKPREWQRQMAGYMAEFGADAIIGHHSHWVGERARIGAVGVPTYYSLGNLVFDQMWSEQTQKGLVVKLKLDKRGRLREVWERPVRIYDYGQPRWDGEWELVGL